MSTTPKRDAVLAWLAGDRTGPIVWPIELEDWPDWDHAQRLDATVACGASGAPAELPIRYAVVNGKRIPPPPVREFRHGAPAPTAEVAPDP